MSSNFKEVLGLIEKFETVFDEYQQALEKDKEAVFQNLNQSWKKMKEEQAEIESLEHNISSQSSELTELKMKSELLDKQLTDLNSIKQESLSKVTELKSSLEKVIIELKTPMIELESYQSKLTSLNEKLNSKELENAELEQKKLDNENREHQLKVLYTEEKMDELERKLASLKRNNYFTTFLIENSKEELSEVDIISTIMNQGSCNLDELKNLLDVPPIMAIRTIKQLAVKGIINLDESTNIVSLP